MTAVRFLADTNVVSEIVRPAPNRGVLRWATEAACFALSAVTVEELEYGLALRPNPRVRDLLDDLFAQFCTVLPVTEAIARRSGELRGRLGAGGEVREPQDTLLAATAWVHELTVVTRNVRHFERCEVQVLDPFGHPGTPLARRAVAEGVIEADDDLLQPRFYVAPGLDPWLRYNVPGGAR